MKARYTSSAANNFQIWVAHYTLDPFIVMVSLGILGHMRDLPVLYSFSYIQMFLINVALQHIFPVVTDPKIIATHKKVKI